MGGATIACRRMKFSRAVYVIAGLDPASHFLTPQWEHID